MTVIHNAQTEAGPSRTISASLYADRPSQSTRKASRREEAFEHQQLTQSCEDDDDTDDDEDPDETCASQPYIPTTTSLSSSHGAPLKPAGPSCSTRQRSARTTRTTRMRFSSSSSSASILLNSLLALLVILVHVPNQANAQLVAPGEANNVTSLQGTWSTGAGLVSTGINFYNPVNTTFNVPNVGGQSYSFTDDGYWEQAMHLYIPNAARPACVSAQLIWQHGSYVLNANNSLTLTPFNGDGRQVIEDRCSSTSTSSTYYYQEEFMLGFDIVLDLHYNTPAYRLQLYAFDGALKPLMWQTHNPPQMLPNELLVQTIYGATS